MEAGLEVGEIEVGLATTTLAPALMEVAVGGDLVAVEMEVLEGMEGFLVAVEDVLVGEDALEILTGTACIFVLGMMDCLVGGEVIDCLVGGETIDCLIGSEVFVFGATLERLGLEVVIVVCGVGGSPSSCFFTASTVF